MLRSYLITSTEELADHADRWEALRQESGGTVFASNYLTRAWFDVYGHIAEPRVIMVEENGDLVGVAPMASYRYNVARLPIKVLALAGEMKDRLRLSTTSLLYAPERKDVLDRMLNEIKRLDWSLLTTINLRTSQANTMYLDSVKATWQSQDYSSGKLLTYPLPKTGNMIESLEAKPRGNLKNRINRLERDGRKVEYRRLSSEDIDRAVDLFAKNHVERWTPRGGSYFQDPDNVRYLKHSTAQSFRAGRGHAYELLIDGKVAAQEFDIMDGTTCYGDKLGMNDEFMTYSPGWLMMMHVMTNLRDQGAERCVLGVGGEEYKYKLGGVEEPLIGVRATRGAAAILARISRSSVVRKMGSQIGFSTDKIKAGEAR
jgi:CelD/BcsL family acetyltransferase involved in cellulose biosynthesis